MSYQTYKYGTTPSSAPALKENTMEEVVSKRQSGISVKLRRVRRNFTETPECLEVLQHFLGGSRGGE